MSTPLGVKDRARDEVDVRGGMRGLAASRAEANERDSESNLLRSFKLVKYRLSALIVYGGSAGTRLR